jgi:hypothetical protein
MSLTSELAYTRLYVGPDGVSHFETARLPLAKVPGAPGLQGAMPVNLIGDVKGATLARLAAGVTEDWHHAPTRMLMLCLQGIVAITARKYRLRAHAARGHRRQGSHHPCGGT